MAERKISEMTVEELKLYKKQLNAKAAEVDFELQKKLKFSKPPKKE